MPSLREKSQCPPKNLAIVCLYPGIGFFLKAHTVLAGGSISSRGTGSWTRKLGSGWGKHEREGCVGRVRDSNSRIRNMVYLALSAATVRVQSSAGTSRKGSVARPSCPSFLKTAPKRVSLVVRAEDAAVQKSDKTEKTEKKAAPAAWRAPTLNPDTPSPIFGGSTGGLLRKAQVEEFYVISFSSPKEQIFEMPTGGAAIMRSGANLLKLARKEQCLALGTQLRTKFKIDYAIHRVFPSGEVQFLHPADGTYPEKVNAGRQGANQNMRKIGENANPVSVKFARDRNVFGEEGRFF